jgi:diaminopimelate epimerase
MARLRFTKMHGIGNDYVYVDCFSQSVVDASALARRVSPRHTGVGSDGLILIHPSDTADCRMEMYNADGSRGEMCGNGIRCVAKYVFDHGLARRQQMRVETDSGIKTLQLEVSDGRVGSVAVDMGSPELDGAQIPVAAVGRVVDRSLSVDGSSLQVTCVSMGNPHCVTFVPDVEHHPVSVVGPLLERHPFFPERANIEFVQILHPDEIRMRVWERGSGETAACGTGACAALVAGVLNGHTQRRATVHLNGGDLDIEWNEESDHVIMIGPAEEVFAGELEV